MSHESANRQGRWASLRAGVVTGLCRWRWQLLACVFGASLTLAFAPFEWRLFALLSPTLWLWLCLHQRAKIWSITFFYALGFFGTGVHWLYHSLFSFAHLPLAVAVVLAVLLIVFLSAFFSLQGWLIGRCLPQPTKSWQLLLIVPSIWVAQELLRSRFLGGFPWLSLGYSQVDTPLSGYAPLLGVFGVSWVTVLSVTLLYVLGRSAWRGDLSPCRWFGFAAGLLSIWLIGIGLSQVNWSSPAGEPLRVRMVQGNTQPSIAPSKKQIAARIEHYIAMSTATDEPVDLIIWPESSISAVISDFDEILQPFWQAQYAQGTHVLVGGFDSAVRNGRREYYNALRMLHDPNQAYYKHHLVPFGEYFPLPFIILPLMQGLFGLVLTDLSPPPADWQATPIRVKGHSMSLSICYEGVFGGEWAGRLSDESLLINVSNDGWFGGYLAAEQHLEMARMRTLETALPMVRVTTTGISALISHRASIQLAIGRDQAASVDVSVQPRQGTTPYRWWTDWGIALLLLCQWLALAALAYRHRRGSAPVPPRRLTYNPVDLG